MTTIVFFELDGERWPVLKVIETPRQVLIALRSETPEEHLTLHREDDGTVVLTHRSPGKPPSTWDRDRVAAARRCGYRDPEKHAHYYQHRPLYRRVEGMDGHEMAGRRIRIDAAPALKPKEARVRHVVIAAPAREFMLTFVLGTTDQPYSAPDDPHVVTDFGKLYFRAEA